MARAEFMGNFISRRFLLTSLPVLIACLSIALILTVLSKHKVPISPPMEQLRKLPDDVDMVMERYKYRETDAGLLIDISGKRVAHRGREILGLRSNLVKTTCFENIRGKIRGKRTLVEFSAATAEWDGTSSGPLVLRNNVALSVNNRLLADVKSARIYLRQGVLVVTGKRKEVFQLRQNQPDNMS